MFKLFFFAKSVQAFKCVTTYNIWLGEERKYPWLKYLIQVHNKTESAKYATQHRYIIKKNINQSCNKSPLTNHRRANYGAARYQDNSGQVKFVTGTSHKKKEHENICAWILPTATLQVQKKIKHLYTKNF